MNDSGGSVTVQVHAAIAEIPAAAWDACAGDVNPSVSYAFLSALEDSGSATARTGWAPQHLSLAGPDGTILGGGAALLPRPFLWRIRLRLRLGRRL